MKKREYSLKNKELNFTQRVVDGGFNAAACILFSAKEAGKGFLEELPSSYSGFALMKWTFGIENQHKEFKKETIRVNFYRLKKQGLITKDPNKAIYFLTSKGKKFVNAIESRYSVLKKPWDGKFRIVIFDIPEKYGYWRRIIRRELLFFKFQQLQKSVYIGKYPMLKSFYQEMRQAGIDKHIFLFTVDEIDKEKEVLELLEEKK